MDRLSRYEILLASKSPRRKELMQQSGLTFKSVSIDTDENYPSDLPITEVALFLANKKASEVKNGLAENQIILTCDTVVVSENVILNKPENAEEAFKMLQKLSNTTHSVITGVCLKSKHKLISFSDTTEVTFKKLNNQEINYYVDKYSPFDKAGAYGIQEWIGLIGVISIKGSYYNVVGLPINKIYEALTKF